MLYNFQLNFKVTRNEQTYFVFLKAFPVLRWTDLIIFFVDRVKRWRFACRSWVLLIVLFLKYYA